MAERFTGELVDDEALANDLARFFHIKRHKSDRTYFCASDRAFAEELITHLNDDRYWLVVERAEVSGDEDDRSS